jgi:heterotetrameric sarcosine oxidase gamma subunit
MADRNVSRASALGPLPLTRLHSGDVVIDVVPNLTLHQIAAWPDTVAAVKAMIQKRIKTKDGITPRTVVTRQEETVIWIDPLKFWFIGARPDELKAETGTTLDLSHAYVHLRVSGNDAVTLLNKHLPLDLREKSFPNNATGASAIHHIQVRLWRKDDVYNLLVPRGFAQSIYEILTH